MRRDADGGAHGHGLYWPTTCGGQGICTTCLTEVVSGGEALAEMGRSERKTLVAERGEAILARPMRLACQTAVLRRRYGHREQGQECDPRTTSEAIARQIRICAYCYI